MLIITVLLLDSLLGDPQGSLHPVALFGKLATYLEKIFRAISGDGFSSGMCCALVAIAIFTVLPVIVVLLALQVDSLLGLGAAAVCIYVTIALRSLNDHAKAVEDALHDGNLDQARQKVGMIVSRDTEKLDNDGVIRSCIESVGENVIDGITAAIFYAAVGWCFGGLAGAAGAACFYRAVNILDAMFGYRNEKYRRFGTFAARLDDVLNFIPARLTLVAIFPAALFAGLRAVSAVKYAWLGHRKHPSPNSGWGMAAFAGALGVKLGGPTLYKDGVKNYEEWGIEVEKLAPLHICRARMLAYGTTLFFSAFSCAVFVLLRRIIAL